MVKAIKKGKPFEVVIEETVPTTVNSVTHKLLDIRGKKITLQSAIDATTAEYTRSIGVLNAQMTDIDNIITQAEALGIKDK